MKGEKMKTLITSLVSVLLLSAFATNASADVSTRLAFQLNGPPTELIAAISKGRAIQARINPDVQISLLVNVAHGANVRSASVTSMYRDLAHYAKATATNAESKEWGEFIANFPATSFPISYSGLSQVLIDGNADSAEGGEAFGIFVFNAGGDVAGLTQLVQQAKSIQSKVNPKASISALSPIATGDGAGSVVVVTRYPSLIDWAEGSAKLQASEEWGQFIAAFPVEKFPIVYQGLSEAAPI
jgi:hypothetical protein